MDVAELGRHLAAACDPSAPAAARWAAWCAASRAAGRLRADRDVDDDALVALRRFDAARPARVATLVELFAPGADPGRLCVAALWPLPVPAELADALEVFGWRRDRGTIALVPAALGRRFAAAQVADLLHPEPLDEGVLATAESLWLAAGNGLCVHPAAALASARALHAGPGAPG